MKRVLVTGANGFIGTALCRRLQSEGCEVVAALRRPDTPFIIEEIRCVSVGHIDGQTDWSQAVADIDAVIHLASRVHVMNDHQHSPIDAYRKVNVEGTKRLAESAMRAGVKRLVFLSSVKVNGEENAVAYTENDRPAPADGYGISKMEAEQALHAIADRSTMEVVTLRPPLVYGPGVKANFLALMRLIARKAPLPFGSVQNRRSFIYLENLIDCIHRCMTHPAAAGQTYMVSDDHDLSTPELILSLAAAMNKTAFLFPFPLGILRTLANLMGKTEAVQRLLGSLTVDISKIKSDLGWSPPITVTSGLLATSRWFQGRKRSTDLHRSTAGDVRPFLPIGKRLFDIILAVCLLSLFSIPMVLIGIVIRLTSEGPAFYWSDRIGVDNTTFSMPKFRTMKIDTPIVATHLLNAPEQHLTRIGKELRRYSLDELPQLLSVFKGDMSFVGPRPALYNQDDLIHLRTEKGIHRLVPGITGWAQINGRDELPIPAKVDLDEFYLKHRSVTLDMKILFMTVFSVAGSKGITH